MDAGLTTSLDSDFGSNSGTGSSASEASSPPDPSCARSRRRRLLGGRELILRSFALPSDPPASAMTIHSSPVGSQFRSGV